MKKILYTVLIIALIVGGVIWYVKRDPLSNDRAERDTNGRYLTIINETNQVINEVHVYINSGTEIESMKQENVDKTSFSIKIPKTYLEYNTFVVVIKDRYGTEYQKKVSEVSPKGRTEIVIRKEDSVKETDSIKNKIDRFFNGD